MRFFAMLEYPLWRPEFDDGSKAYHAEWADTAEGAYSAVLDWADRTLMPESPREVIHVGMTP